MHAPVVQPGVADVPERARFETLRRRIFEEMSHDTARWRLTWFLVFNVCALAILFAAGESGPRFVIQAVAVAVLGTMFAVRIRWDPVPLRIVSFLLAAAAFFAMLATTGGLASPFLMTSAVTLSAASILLRHPAWARRAVILTFSLGLVTLALLSRTSLGKIIAPLDSMGGVASATYVTLALMSSLYTMTGVFRMGCHMTLGYERVALELAARREQLCGEAEERTRALEGVAARLAHEVKNPLAAIKGLSTHMARNAADAKTAERLAIVAAEADRLQAIVDGFLSFSRGLDELKLAPTRLHEVGRELGVLLETRAEDAGVLLEIAGDEALVVDADVRKLRQVLLNLVINALQASPRGSKVLVQVARDAFGAVVTVRDEGSGMSAEILERIRKPFFTTKEGGTGLGVAVARGLVEQHGGQLEFKSAPGKGTTVTIRLPATASPCSQLPRPWRSHWGKCAERDARDGRDALEARDTVEPAPSTRPLPS
jgi:signal transduction histidine kinase